MPGPADILRELHRLRRHVAELDAKTEQAPRLLKGQQTKLANQEAALKQAQDELKHLKMKVHELDVSIKSAQEQVNRYERQLKEQITSKKEYDALTAEIKHGRETIGKLEDEALAALTDVEVRAAKLPEIEAATKKAKADYAQYETDHADRLNRFADERAKALAELKTVEATLPPDIKAQYDRMIAAKGPDAVAGVQGRTCTACYTEITPQMSSQLTQGNVVICKNCGRMLYAEQ